MIRSRTQRHSWQRSPGRSSSIRPADDIDPAEEREASIMPSLQERYPDFRPRGLSARFERMPSLQERYPDFRPRGLSARFERWLYPADRPNRLARLLNRGSTDPEWPFGGRCSFGR
jgi:hypothetical protein